LSHESNNVFSEILRIIVAEIVTNLTLGTDISTRLSTRKDNFVEELGKSVSTSESNDELLFFVVNEQGKSEGVLEGDFVINELEELPTLKVVTIGTTVHLFELVFGTVGSHGSASHLLGNSFVIGLVRIRDEGEEDKR
jgi:hypothetical protein